jgi:stalled ribosome rescue protein Dom34
MALYHAVVWIDHHNALIHQFSASRVESASVRDHRHYTRQHGSDVRAIHEFYADVCDALAGVPEILVTGAHQSNADFRHYVEKHRPQLLPAIRGWEVSERLTDAQLVALGRKHFDRINRIPPAAPQGA